MKYLFVKKVGIDYFATNSLNEIVSYIISEPITDCYFNFSGIQKHLLTEFFITYKNNLIDFLFYDIMNEYQYVVEVDLPYKGFCFHRTILEAHQHYNSHGIKLICLIDGYETIKSSFNWKKEGF